MSDEKEIEGQKIATPEQMLQALVNRIVDGDAAESQEIVDGLGEWIKKRKG